MRYEGPDDKQLLALIVEQDRGALEAFYDRYTGAVFWLAVKMLREQGAAEEVTQDTFFNVWRRAFSYKSGRGSVTAWLFSIAHHRTIDELLRRRRESTRVQFGVDLSNKPSDGRDDPIPPGGVRGMPLNLEVEGQRESGSPLRSLSGRSPRR